MTSSLKVAIVGCGRFGQRHAEAYRGLGQVEIVAVYDVVAARAQSLAQRLGVLAADSLESALDRADAVNVVVPPPDLASVARACLRRGAHVLLEKPMAETPSAARELYAAAKERRLLLRVGYVERFHPAVMLAACMMPQPQLMRFVRSAPRHDHMTSVDVVHDLMTHDIDHALRFAGSEPLEVVASGRSISGAVNDVVRASIAFADGSRAELGVDRTGTRPERTITLADDDRVIEVDLLNSQIIMGSERMQVPLGNPLARQNSAFISDILNGFVDARMEPGARVLETAARIIGQTAMGRPASVEPHLGRSFE